MPTGFQNLETDGHFCLEISTSIYLCGQKRDAETNLHILTMSSAIAFGFAELRTQLEELHSLSYHCHENADSWRERFRQPSSHSDIKCLQDA